MKQYICLAVFWSTVAAWALAPASARVAIAQANTWAVVLLDGGAPAAVFDLNAAGRMVGSVTPAGESNARAVWWQNPESAGVELPLLPGTNWSRAFAVNARGQMAGLVQDRSISPPRLFAAFWEHHSAAPVALSDGITAVAINDAGEVAGNITLDGAVRAAVWTDPAGPPTALATFGGASSGAADIDNAGQVVGSATYADLSRRAAFWPSASDAPLDLGTVAGAARSAATAINERGEIAGEAVFATGQRVALFWPFPGAAPVALSTLGGASGIPVAIDGRGRIVGQAQTASGAMHAAVWLSPDEPPIDLGVGFARAINTRGVVAGEQQNQAVAWTR